MPTKPASMMTPEEYAAAYGGGASAPTQVQVQTPQPPKGQTPYWKIGQPQQQQPIPSPQIAMPAQSYWENPSNLVKQYNAYKSLPPGAKAPDWFDFDTVDAAYRYMAALNLNAPTYAWKGMAANDPGRALFQKMQPPEVENWWEVQQPGQQYQVPDQVQPDFFTEDPNDNWYTKLMKRVLSSPRLTMGVVSAANAIGNPTSMPAAFVTGMALGEAANRAPWLARIIDKVFTPGEMVFKFPYAASEYLPGAIKEKGLAQVIAELDDLYSASRQAYRIAAPNWGVQAPAEQLWTDKMLADLGPTPSPAQIIEYTKTHPQPPNVVATGIEEIIGIRQQLEKNPAIVDDYIARTGEKISRNVAINDLLDQYAMEKYGVDGLARDLTFSSIFDALNFWGVLTKGATLPAAMKFVTNPVAREALQSAFAGSKGGLWEGLNNYGVRLATKMEPGQLATLDPMSRWFAGVTDKGMPKILTAPTNRFGSLNKPLGAIAAGAPYGALAYFAAGGGPWGLALGIAGAALGGKTGWDTGLSYLKGLTPAMRAREITDLTALNLDAIQARVPDATIDDYARLVKRFAGGDPELARQLSMEVLNSPEGLAGKFAIEDAESVVDDAVTNYHKYDGQRTMLNDISKATGRSLEDVLREIGKSSDTKQPALKVSDADIILQHFKDKAPDNLKAGLANVKGTDLVKIFNAFIRDGVAYSEEGGKAQLTGALLEKANEVATSYFGVKPDPAFIRLGAAVKTAQSLVLLGLNPTYVINNAIDNIVSMAFMGVIKFGKLSDMEEFWTKRVGYRPPALKRAMGPAAMGEAMDATMPQYRATRAAIKGDDWIETFQAKAGRALDKFGIFSRMAQTIEAKSSLVANTAAFQHFWKSNFDRVIPGIPGDLMRALMATDPSGSLVKVLQMAIAGGMNPREIEAALQLNYSRVAMDSLIPDLAANRGEDVTIVRETLSKFGIDTFFQDKFKDNPNADNKLIRSWYAEAHQLINKKLDEWHTQQIPIIEQDAENRAKVEGPQYAVDAADFYFMSTFDTINSVRDMWTDAWRAAEEFPTAKTDIFNRTRDSINAIWKRANEKERAHLDGIRKSLGDTPKQKAWVDARQTQHVNWQKYFDAKAKMWAEFFATDFEGDVGARSVRAVEIKFELNRMFEEAYKEDLRLQGDMDRLAIEMITAQFPDNPEAVAAFTKYRETWMKMRREHYQETHKFHRDVLQATFDEEQAMKKEFYNNRLRQMTWDQMMADLDGMRTYMRSLFGTSPEKPIEPTRRPPAEPERPAEPTPPPEPERPPEEPAPTEGIPFVITQDMRSRLRRMGYTDNEIADMTPADAWEKLNQTGAPKPMTPEEEASWTPEPEPVTTFTPDDLTTALDRGDVNAILEISDALGYDNLPLELKTRLKPLEDAKNAITEVRTNKLPENIKGPIMAILTEMHQSVKFGEPGKRIFLQVDTPEKLEIKRQASTYPKWYGVEGDQIYKGARYWRPDGSVVTGQAAVVLALEDMLDGNVRRGALIEKLSGVWYKMTLADPEIISNILGIKRLPSDYEIVAKINEIYTHVNQAMFSENLDYASELLGGVYDDLSQVYPDGNVPTSITEWLDKVANHLDDRAQELNAIFLNPPGPIRLEPEKILAEPEQPEMYDMGGVEAFTQADWDEVAMLAGPGEWDETPAPAPAPAPPAPPAPKLLPSASYRKLLYTGMQRVFDYPEPLARAHMQLTEARARLWAQQYGKNPAEWYRSRIGGFARGFEEPTAEGIPAAARDLDAENKAIFIAFQAKNWSSMIHELFHVFVRDLEGDDLRIAQDWAGAKNGVWDEASLEKIARGGERYIWEGIAPSPAMQKVFNLLRDWIRKVYEVVSGSAIDVEISDEMRGVYDRLFVKSKRKPINLEYDPAKPKAPEQPDMFTPSGRQTIEMKRQQGEESLFKPTEEVRPTVLPGFEETMKPPEIGSRAKPPAQTTDLGPLFGIREPEPAAVEPGAIEVQPATPEAATILADAREMLKETGDQLIPWRARLFQKYGGEAVTRAFGGEAQDIVRQWEVWQSTINAVAPGMEYGAPVRADQLQVGDTYWDRRWGVVNVQEIMPADPRAPDVVQVKTERGMRYLARDTIVTTGREAAPAPEAIQPEPVAPVAPEVVPQNAIMPGIQSTGQGLFIARLLDRLGLSESATADDFWVKVHNPPYIDLDIETHGDRIYFTHYLTQNGDTFIDSEMVYRFHKNGRLELVETATQDPFNGGESRSNDAGFARMFAKNLLDQGFGTGKMVDPRAVVDSSTREQKLLNHLYGRITNNEVYTNKEFETYLRQQGFNLDDEKDINLAYDLMEGAFNLAARDRRAELKNAPLAERLAAMDELEAQLTRARRTLGKMELQQFSTPLTISEAAAQAADVKPGDIIGEATAGTGNLVDMFMGRDDVTVKVNEIDAARRTVLANLGHDPTGIDVMSGEWLLAGNKLLGPWANVMIINPPWGAYKTGKYGRAINTPVELNDWSQRFTHLIMQRLADDGRIVIVAPTNWVYSKDRTTGFISSARSEFVKWLYQNYSVRAIIESPEDAYKYRSTGVGSLMVVVDKNRQLSPTIIEAFGLNAPRNWEEYAKIVDSIGARYEGAVKGSQDHVTNYEAREQSASKHPDTPTTGPDAAGLAEIGRLTSPDVEQRPAGTGGITRGGGEPSAPTGSEPDRSPGYATEPPREKRPSSAFVVEEKSAGISSTAKRPVQSAAWETRIATSREAIDRVGVFVEYVGRVPLTENDLAQPHPTLIIETKSLSGVPFPPLEPEYRPSPWVMDALNNRVLSVEGNIDPIWAAIQQNDKYKSGLLVADDVGTGKSRTAAGFVIDRIQRGKKRILVVTMNEQNVDNLMDEFNVVYAGVADENGNVRKVPKEFPARKLWLNGDDLPKVKKGLEPAPTFDEPTVYFTTAYQFAEFSDAIDGLNVDVVVVDEAHAFKGLETARGSAWFKLHDKWTKKDTDFLYLSATPGQDLEQLKYLYGLKIWTMDGFEDWIKVITGEISPEEAKKRQGAAKRIDDWLNTINAAYDKIITKDETRWGDTPGKLVANRFFVYVGKEYNSRGQYVIYDSVNRNEIGWVASEVEAVILADMMKDEAQPTVYDTRRRFEQIYGKLDPADVHTWGLIDATDAMKNNDKKKSWRKTRGTAFDTKITPAHTEQIMRELKVGGHYMSRDIARTGVDFEVKSVVPSEKDIAAFDGRVDVYRKITEAFNKWGPFNQDPKKKKAGAFGVSGDVQGDAKRALFHMRLPAIVQEIKDALARGEQVVISTVSVSETSPEKGYLVNAVSKINTHEVKKIKGGGLTDPKEIPEAMIDVAVIRELIAEMPILPAPHDVFSQIFGDNFDYVIGEVSAPRRKKITRAFQNNEIDVLMISGAGKTGINLHDITGKRRIHLIVGDYEWSPTTFKQELGRVDRTGQLSSPKVTVLHNGSAGEVKFVSTIANRMQGIGATSKGASESTGTGALTEEFELGTTLDKIALADLWQKLSNREKELFLDTYFDDRHVRVKRSTIPPNAESIKKFTKAMQAVPFNIANEIWARFLEIREKLVDSDAAGLDENRKTAMFTGEIVRQTQLSPNLRISEVTNEAGESYALLDGLITPYMPTIKEAFGRRETDYMDSISQGAGAWIKYVRMTDKKTGQTIAGMRIPKGKIDAVVSRFGILRETLHTPDTALIDLNAGDKINITGADMAEWRLYMGQGGAREGRIVIDGAKMKDKDPLLNNGAAYNPLGNFFFVPEENLPQFLKRFPIRGGQQEPRRLYQRVAPWGNVEDDFVRAPLGAIANPNMPVSAGMDETYATKAAGYLTDLERMHTNTAARLPTNFKKTQLDARTSQQLKGYLEQVHGSMADLKAASAKWGENRRDAALLNYNRRYGFDNLAQTVFPYQFWYTRSMMKWLQIAVDRPAVLANYARLRNAMYEMDKEEGFPTRLTGKIRLNFPWLEQFAGPIYIDPFRALPMEQMARPMQMWEEGRTNSDRAAEYIIMAKAGQKEITDAEADEAMRRHTGRAWEDAVAQARLEQDSDMSNPYEMVTAMFGPTLPLGWAYNMKKKGNVSNLPVTNLVRSLTAIAGVGGPGGANIEGPIRKALGLPVNGNQFWDYYIDRELSNMAAMGADVQDVLDAMVNRSGPLYDQALTKVGKMQGARNLFASVYLDFFPEGEQRQRALQQEFEKAAEAGQLATFFEKHPEYEARMLANTFDDPEERMRRFVRSRIWDQYYQLPELERRVISDELGDLFQNNFLNKETRSYSSIETETLISWAQKMGARLPEAVPPGPQDAAIQMPEAAVSNAFTLYKQEEERLFPGIGAMNNWFYSLPAVVQDQVRANYPEIAKHARWKDQQLYKYPDLIQYLIGEDNMLYGADPAVAAQVYQYRAERESNFPGILEKQDAYYNVTGVERKAYLAQHPELKEYWDWRKWFMASNTKTIPYIRGIEGLTEDVLGKDYVEKYGVWKDLDPADFSSPLQRQLMGWAYAGQKLSKGAIAELEMLWEQAGRPGGSLEWYLNNVISQKMMQ